MVYANRTLITCAVLSAGFLSACADATNPTITRASQINEILNQPPQECSDDVVSRTLAQSLRETEEGSELLRDLDNYCPDLVILESATGEEPVTLASVTTETPDTETPSGPVADAETPADSGSDTGTDTGGTDTGPDTGETDTEADPGNDDSGSKGGKNGNNGGGNGSEGSSPGQGSGANQDE